MKQLALCLSGLHFKENYHHFMNMHIDINFKEYVKNIKTKIYSFFEKDFQIDTFICTEKSELLDELLNTYNPVKYYIEERGHCWKKLKVLELLMDYIEINKKKYDNVILTRFDFYILKEFTKDNIDLNKFNIISSLNDVECDDNFFLFPIEYLKIFKDILKNRFQYNDAADSLHLLKLEYESKMNVNYICDEPGHASYDLSFFNLRPFKDLQLILNKNIYTENVTYKSIYNHSEFLINKDVYEFKKLTSKPSHFSWLGYEIKEIGLYHLSFEIYSNKNINFDFIKIHKPTTFFKIDDICENEWKKIDILIDVKEPNDLLCFIFDEYPETIKILYKNFSCLKVGHGFEVDKLKTRKYLSNKCQFTKINENSFEFEKDETYQFVPFVWCGVNYEASKVKTNLKFDICFISEVPTINDNFFIKTHSPLQNINDWLIKCKQGEFVTIEIPLSISKEKQLILFMLDECRKSVKFVVKNLEFISNPITYTFITFFTQGEPFDKCYDLTNQVRDYSKKICNFIDKIKLYNAYEFKKNKDLEYLVKEFKYETALNPNTHLIGFLRWKPYIILQTLLESNDGDIIFYRDSNCHKYPQILSGVENTISTIDFVLKKSDIYIPIENYPKIKKKHNVKKEVFEHFEMHNNSMLESYLYNASIVICKKTDKTIQFMKDWLSYCLNDELINCNYGVDQHPDFWWNTQEQAIMNLLIEKYNKLKLWEFNQKILNYSIIERNFQKSQMKKVLKVAVFIPGEMRNCDNQYVMYYNNKNLLDLYNCDIFASVWDKKGFSPDHGTISNKEYSNKNINEEKLNNIYKNIKKTNIENFDEWFDQLSDTYKDLYNKGFEINNRKVKGTTIPQLYKIWDCNRLKTEYEKENGFEYDLVIRIRPDMCFLEEIPDSFLHDFFYNENSSILNKIYTLNPPKIFFPNRIYDAFFYGNSNSMNKICNVWPNILECIEFPFDNGLPNLDACRVLFVNCIINQLEVVNISRSFTEIYRDEPIDEFIHQILHLRN
jgi:hypothetical protein